MNRTIAATALALVALANPVLAQTAPTDDTVTVQAPASEQVTRGSNGFRINESTNAFPEQVQKIFDEIRAENGTGTTR